MVLNIWYLINYVISNNIIYIQFVRKCNSNLVFDKILKIIFLAMYIITTKK